MGAQEAMHGMQVFEAFSSFSSKRDIRYNTEKLEAAVCDAEESQEHKEQIEYMKMALPHMLAPQIGEETVRTLAGLKDHAAHLHSIRLAGGLPKDYEIYMEFENFHLTPVIAEFLQLPEEEEDSQEDAVEGPEEDSQEDAAEVPEEDSQEDAVEDADTAE